MVVGLVAVVLIAGLVSLGIRAAQGAYADTYRLTAVFTRSGQGLDSFSTVKIRGVTVGSVTNIRLRPDGRAEITLEIQDGVEIPDTVVASGEPLSVFGPKFIKLDLGAHEGSGPYLRDGDVIGNTRAATEITDLLSEAASVFDALDPTELHTIIATLADGLRNLGPDLAAIVDDASLLADLAVAHDAEAKQFLRDLAALSGTLAAHGTDVTSAAADLRSFLPSISGHRDELGELLDAASRISKDLAAVVDGHADDLDQIVSGVSRTVQALYDQLGCVSSFVVGNVSLFRALGGSLLSYELPDGHIAGVVTGPYSFAALLEPPPMPVRPDVPPCTGGAR